MRSKLAGGTQGEPLPANYPKLRQALGWPWSWGVQLQHQLQPARIRCSRRRPGTHDTAEDGRPSPLLHEGVHGQAGIHAPPPVVAERAGVQQADILLCTLPVPPDGLQKVLHGLRDGSAGKGLGARHS